MFLCRFYRHRTQVVGVEHVWSHRFYGRVPRLDKKEKRSSLVNHIINSSLKNYERLTYLDQTEDRTLGRENLKYNKEVLLFKNVGRSLFCFGDERSRPSFEVNREKDGRLCDDGSLESVSY